MRCGFATSSVPWLGVVLIVLFVETLQDGVTIPNYVHFPRGNPYVGIFVAIAIPLDLRGPADVFFSMNFESSYPLPQNQTEFTYPPIIGSTTRQMIYRFLESKINSYGFPGRQCLQRAVCEATEYTTRNYGVLGDIVHILLTPSTTKKESNMTDFVDAERFAREQGNCKKYRENCKLSILNLISKVTNKFKGY
ncbi:unnamed protein product, partial [Callosobruchus maculatus]